MELWNQIRGFFKGEADKLRKMSFTAKLGYLFSYYKGWFALLLVLVLFGGYIADLVIQGQKEIVLQGFFTNDEHGLFHGSELEKEFDTYLGLEKNQRIVFDDGLYVDLNGEATEYSAASNGKIIAYMATRELDFVITSKEVYEHFAADVPLADLAQFLPEELRGQLTPCLVAATGPEGEAISGALELSQSRFLRDTEVPEGSYYMFVPYHVPHPQALSNFIRFCFPPD